MLLVTSGRTGSPPPIAGPSTVRRSARADGSRGRVDDRGEAAWARWPIERQDPLLAVPTRKPGALSPIRRFHQWPSRTARQLPSGPRSQGRRKPRRQSALPTMRSGDSALPSHHHRMDQSRDRRMAHQSEPLRLRHLGPRAEAGIGPSDGQSNLPASVMPDESAGAQACLNSPAQQAA